MKNMEKLITDLDARVKWIKSHGQYKTLRRGKGLRSAQVIALAERVGGVIAHCERLTARVEALERRRDSKC